MVLEPQLRRLAPQLYQLRLPGGDAHLLNSYLWLDRDGVTLFDTGWDTSAPIIAAGLHRLGRSEGDVERVVLSHFHEDHAGSAAEISAWSDSVVLVGSADAPFVRGEILGPLPSLTPAERSIRAEPRDAVRTAPCRVDREVRGGETLDFAGGATVLHVPGHTPGSIALFLPSANAVLTGDTAAEFEGQVIRGVFNTDRERVADSVRRLADTGAQIAGFGHGEAIISGASARLAAAVDPFA